MAPKKRAINPDSVFECEVCGEMFDDLETATEHENACTNDGTLEDDAEEDAETMGQMPEVRYFLTLCHTTSCATILSIPGRFRAHFPALRQQGPLHAQPYR